MKTSVIILAIVVVIIIIVGIYFLAAPVASNKNQTENMNLQNQANNSVNSNIQGMKVEILKQGTGDGAKVGDNIVVNYVGTLENGTKFDSSIDRKQPFPYTLGENMVIQGWEKGLLGMKVGEKRKLTIPPELGYGAQSPSPAIPANSILIFEVELLGINQ